MSLENLAPPKRTELWEEVLVALRDAIVHGELAPGTRLIESELAQNLNVSRWPVRQAIAHLEQEALVVRYPNRGAYVVEFAEADIEEIFDLRALIEGHAARKACLRMTPEHEARLRSLVDETERLTERGVATETIAPDIAFHRAIFGIAGSQRLEKLWDILVAPINTLLYMRTSRQGVGYIQGVARVHAGLLEALCSGDPDLAEAAFCRELAKTRRSLLEYLSSSSD